MKQANPFLNSGASQELNVNQSTRITPLSFNKESIGNTPSSKTKMLLPASEGLNFIPIEQILYFEADGNYTHVFLKDGSKMLICKTLKEFSEKLSNPPFFRIHRSFIINLTNVQKYVRGRKAFVEMEGGKRIDISMSRKDAFKRMLSVFFF